LRVTRISSLGIRSGESADALPVRFSKRGSIMAIGARVAIEKRTIPISTKMTFVLYGII
jgi:hypothetical protein